MPWTPQARTGTRTRTPTSACRTFRSPTAVRDVIVHRAETVGPTPARPEHVLLVVEVVSSGSETTDRIVKADQYAKAGIPLHWRVEQTATGVPIVSAYVPDPATRAHGEGEMFTGTVEATAPSSLTVDPGVM